MLRAHLLLIPALATLLSAANFSGASALDHAKAAVAFGPRPAGSEPVKKLQAYIMEHTRVAGAQITEDSFVAKTPRGDVPMKNIIVKFPGTSGRAIAITGHSRQGSVDQGTPYSVLRTRKRKIPSGLVVARTTGRGPAPSITERWVET